MAVRSGGGHFLALLGKLLAVVAIPPILFAAIMATCSFSFLDGEFGWYQQNKDYAAVREPYARVLAIGDSTAKSAYLPACLSDDSYNFALGGASVMEEYYYLKGYLETNETPSYLFLTASTDFLTNAGTFWGRSVYFHRMAPDALWDCIATLHEEGLERRTLKRTLRRAITDSLEYLTYSPLKYRDAFLRGLESKTRATANWTNYENAVTNKGWWLLGRAEECSEAYPYFEDRQEFSIDPGLEYYLDRILELCDERDMNLVFVGPPLNEASYAIVTDGFKESYRQFMVGLQERHPEATIVTELYAYPNDCFCDNRHMNRRGAERFCAELRERYPQAFGGSS